MFKFRYNTTSFFRNADVEGTGGDDQTTDSTNTPSTQDPNTPPDTKPDTSDVTKLVEKAVADAVAGLKKKNEEVIGLNKRLKADLDAAKGKPQMSEEEFREYQTLKTRIEQDELLKLLTEGKSEEVVDRISKRTRLDMEAKVAAEAALRAEREAEAANWRTRFESTVIDAEIAKSASGIVKPQYTELLTKLTSDRVKHVDGAVRVLDPATGEIATNANGTPVTVPELIETLRTSYPDLFVTSTGGGAGGSPPRRPTGNAKIPVDSVDETMAMDTYAKLRAEGRI